MLNYFSKYWFDFVFEMTTKEIKARYKRVILGFLWAILNPILQMIVIGFLFQFLFPNKIENYFYFLFSGLLPWNFFSQTIIKSTPIIFNERYLIQKAKFPKEALVLSIVFSNLFHFVISILLFLVISVFFNFISIINFLLLLFAIIWLVIFTIGMSLLLSTLFVKFRDIKFIVQAVIPLWFYATPVMYMRKMLPDWVSDMLLLNPMTALVEFFQSLFRIHYSEIEYAPFIPGIIISICITFLGIYLFKKNNQYFDDWL